MYSLHLTATVGHRFLARPRVGLGARPALHLAHAPPGLVGAAVGLHLHAARLDNEHRRRPRRDIRYARVPGRPSGTTAMRRLLIAVALLIAPGAAHAGLYIPGERPDLPVLNGKVEA